MAFDAHPDAKQGRALTVSLAEYSALQSQIGGHITAQYAPLGIALTAFGVVAGFALGQHADRSLFLVIPPLALLMSLVQGSITYRTLKISLYIRSELLPFLQDLSIGEIPSWEVFEENLRHRYRVIARELVIDGPPIAVFFLASLASSIFVEHVSTELRVVAWCLTALTLVAPLAAPALARGLKSESQNEATAAGAPSRPGPMQHRDP